MPLASMATQNKEKSKACPEGPFGLVLTPQEADALFLMPVLRQTKEATGGDVDLRCNSNPG